MTGRARAPLASSRTTALLRTAVAASSEDPDQHKAAQALADELSLPFLPTPTADTDLLLLQTTDHIELRDLRDPRLGPIWVDFSRFDLRPYGPGLSRRQPLARAFGKKVRTIVDATAGLAQDALRLALMGFQVTAIERSPVVVALARDGLHRFESERGITLGSRLALRAGDARALLPALARPDAIFLDPMFPARRKRSAAVRKEMRVLRDLVGEDPDAVELLGIARAVARERVVVKRADDAPPLAPSPNHSITGKLVRYDVYLAPSA
jgi:16S rRNA (guanine1516-N2)-methyltransferase